MRRHLSGRGWESLAEQFVYDIACNIVHMRLLAILEHLRPVRRSASENGSVAREDTHRCRVNPCPPETFPGGGVPANRHRASLLPEGEIRGGCLCSVRLKKEQQGR